jgi:hypothetical protein
MSAMRCVTDLSITAHSALRMLTHRTAVLLGHVARHLLRGVDHVHPVLRIGQILGENPLLTQELGLVQFVLLLGGVSPDLRVLFAFARHKVSMLNVA